MKNIKNMKIIIQKNMKNIFTKAKKQQKNDNQQEPNSSLRSTRRQPAYIA